MRAGKSLHTSERTGGCTTEAILSGRFAPVSTCGGSLCEGSHRRHVNHLGERRIVETASRTIAMPLENWQDFDAGSQLWAKGGGVYSNPTVRVRGPDAGGSIL
jgi:hypothetical protein